jgi:uncharacterized protein YkuJ
MSKDKKNKKALSFNKHGLKRAILEVYYENSNQSFNYRQIGACGAKGFFDGADRPVDDLIDGAEDRQALGVPRVDHLVESHQGVLRRSRRSCLALGQDA